MKKTILAAALAATCHAAMATNYYVVVPVQNRTATAGNIVVALNGTSLPAGVVGRAYAGFDFQQVLQVKGDPNYDPASARFTVAAGTLPAGLVLSADGKLTGAPTAPGPSSFQVLAAYKTKQGTQGYQVLVSEVTVGLAAATLPAGVQGAAYSYDLKQLLHISGDPKLSVADAVWTSRGTLPPGLQLFSNGIIAGVPSAGGTSSFEIGVSYLGKTGTRTYDVVVGDINISWAAMTPPAGVVGQAYNTGKGFDLKPAIKVEGDAAYPGAAAGVTWSLTSGVLPAGLRLDAASGVINGTPTARSAGSFTIQAAYKDKSATHEFGIPLTVAITQGSGFRAWSDGSLAASCKAYRNPTAADYRYSGATGDGVYRIQPGSVALDVFCDMTTDGGGWTLVMTNNLPNFTNQAGTGTANVCKTITGCNTGGTSSFYLNTPVEATLSEFMLTATQTGHPYDLTWKLVNPPNYIRETVPAPGISLFRLMTDSTPGWAAAGQETVTEGGDRNDASRYFAGTVGVWSDGNWHGAGYAGQEGMQTRTDSPNGYWGHHHFAAAPTLDASGTTYTVYNWTYYPFFGGPVTSTVSRADAENLYRWTIFVR